ncbi:transposase, partial [Xanthomonas hortorum]
LVRGAQPVIVIDWSDLKPDKSWCLLRAAVPVGGRTLTLLDMVVPGKQQGSPGAERRFLQQLRALVPDDVRPILVTDAGFRTPWFRAVSAMGWCWVGRLRGRT